jgi:hypothetical protein
VTESQPESYYRDLLAEQTGGQTEAKLLFGRCDVLTETTVFEVEPTWRWKAGTAQALAYAAQVAHQGALAVYGESWKLPDILCGLAALPEPGLELWWFTGEQWVHVEDYAHARSFVTEPGPEPELPPRTPGPPPDFADDLLWSAPDGPVYLPGQKVNRNGLEVWLSSGWAGPFSRYLEDAGGDYGKARDAYLEDIMAHAPDDMPYGIAKLRYLLFGD